MTKYKNINVKLSKLQLRKLKPATANATEVTLRISSNIFSNSTATNFPTKLLLTNTNIVNIHKLL